MGTDQGQPEHLQRCMPLSCRAMAVVQGVGNNVEVLLVEKVEVLARGQAIPGEANGVLAGVSLPGAVRIAEVDLHAGLHGQVDVPAPLLDFVVREALEHGLSKRPQLGRENRDAGSGTGQLTRVRTARRPTERIAPQVPCDGRRASAQKPTHRQRVHAPLEHARHRHAILGSKLKVPRCLVHVLTLGWRMLHFRFETALSPRLRRQMQ